MKECGKERMRRKIVQGTKFNGRWKAMNEVCLESRCA